VTHIQKRPPEVGGGLCFYPLKKGRQRSACGLLEITLSTKASDGPAKIIVVIIKGIAVDDVILLCFHDDRGPSFL
jgi:uncharacterized protein (DUF983 family)